MAVACIQDIGTVIELKSEDVVGGVLQNKFGEPHFQRLYKRTDLPFVVHAACERITDMLQKTEVIHQRLAIQPQTDCNTDTVTECFYIGKRRFSPQGSSFSKHGNSLMVCKAFIPFAAGAGKADDISAYKKIEIVRGFFCMDQIVVAPKCVQLGDIGKIRVHVLLKLMFFNVFVYKLSGCFFFIFSPRNHYKKINERNQ